MINYVCEYQNEYLQRMGSVPYYERLLVCFRAFLVSEEQSLVYFGDEIEFVGEGEKYERLSTWIKKEQCPKSCKRTTQRSAKNSLIDL